MTRVVVNCWHTIKPGSPEHGTTEQGKASEHRNTDGTSERWWNSGTPAEQSEYHGVSGGSGT